MRLSLFKRLRGNSPSGFGLELLSIVIAIVLGFIVTEWRESLQEAKKAKLALYRIAQEVELNRDAAAHMLPYYEKMLHRMDSLGRDSFNVNSDIKGWEGINPIAFQSSAYQLAIQTGLLSNIDFEMATNISLFYVACDDYGITSSYARQSLLIGQLEQGYQYYTLLELFRQHCQVLLLLAEHLQDDYLPEVPTLPTEE
ncbi:MAG: hypothetical protein HRU41_24430 [Saprospiraceae bacterium]|nr:hypothetical protein [Saprospiraceae bacterium]